MLLHGDAKVCNWKKEITNGWRPVHCAASWAGPVRQCVRLICRQHVIEQSDFVQGIVRVPPCDAASELGVLGPQAVGFA
jgi:hypothetical protein